MALSNEQNELISRTGSQILRSLNDIATRVRQRLSEARPDPPTNVFAISRNPMVGDASTERSTVAAIHYAAREQLARLEREPFVARLIVRWEDEEPPREETVYIARGPVVEVLSSLPDNIKLASYRAALGRLAEFDAGDSVTLPAGYKRHQVSILERVLLRPNFSAGEWDAVEDLFDFETWTAQVESIRRFLEQLETPFPLDEAIPDILGELLLEIEAGQVAAEVSRRKVIEHISLRDQPILNRYQGEIFRMPLDKRLLLLGPPGTGKTTTLIRRLAQKRTTEALTEDESQILSDAGLEREFFQTHSWAMFSPTELLKLYLRDAFNREGVPASDINLKTWEKERLNLGRNVLRLLRSPEGGRFQLDELGGILVEESTTVLTELNEEFDSFVEKEITNRFTEAFNSLLQSDDERLKRIIRNAIGRPSSGAIFSMRDVSSVLEEGSELQAELRSLAASIRQEVHVITNRLVYDHKNILDELVQALPSITLDDSGEEEEEEEEETDDSVLDTEARNAHETQRVAIEILKGTVRSMSRTAALKRSRLRGRARRVHEILGDRIPRREALEKLGFQVVRLTDLRRIINSPKSYVMGIPQMYARFRRDSLKEGRFFAVKSSEAIRQNRISGEELDVLILTMLRNAKRLFQERPSLLNDSSTHDWLEKIKDQYCTQVFVDEATDFSIVQLACMMELADPRLRSWFACGDLNQRITRHGIRDLSEINWLEKAVGDSIELRELDIGYRQSRRLRNLANALSATSGGTDLKAPSTGEEIDVWPLLAENLTGNSLATWLSDRIVEVEKMVGRLPSIAVFVDGEEPIEPLVSLVHPLLAKHNIPVVACKDGRVVGDNLEVRVFDVRHIKGLEFEAVFFVGIDVLARSMPDLFDRFFYVGASRAATYLGVTCEEQLPVNLELVRDHFEMRSW